MASWTPRLSPKQLALYQCDKRYICASGPRYSAKTWAIEHCVLRHAWRVNPSRFGIIVNTNRVGSMGIWTELTGIIYREWVDAGVCSEVADFGWVKPPSIDNITKLRYAILKNRFGGESEIVLFPIERAEEAKEKLLSTQFSALWISEASLYKNEEIFKTARAQLRLAGVGYEDKRVYLDLNPPEEGKHHWVYDVFWRQRSLSPDEYPDFWDDETKKATDEFKRESAVFEFELSDNTYADPRELQNIRSTYQRNEDEYKRFVLGLWTDKVRDSCFYDVWDKNIHVVGDTSDPDEANWDVLAPAETANVYRESGEVKLVSGWDPGDVNHAWVAVQPWYDQKERLGFDVLDEYVLIRDKVFIEDLTVRILERMAALREFAGFDFGWVDYSDSSVYRFAASASKGEAPKDEEQTDAGIILQASKGRVQLVGSAAVKAPGWQRRRVNLLAQLLKERRLRVSAHCTWVIRMFEKLRKDTSEKPRTYLAPDQDEKHIFDALSYPICMMMIDQLLDSPEPHTKRKGYVISV